MASNLQKILKSFNGRLKIASVILSPMGMEERIISNSRICHGKPVIRGTRIMVSNILSLLAGGYTVRQILEYYPELTAEDVKAAIEYAAKMVDGEEVFSLS